MSIYYELLETVDSGKNSSDGAKDPITEAAAIPIPDRKSNQNWQWDIDGQKSKMNKHLEVLEQTEYEMNKWNGPKR